MTHEESPMLPQESLAVIAEAISKTKENFRENASYFLLWGWLIATASGLFFLLHAYTGFRYYFLPFPVLAGAGIIGTLVLYSRRKAMAHSETYIGYFFMRMWLGLGVGFIGVVAVSTARGLPPFAYTLIIAGIGTLSSGLAMRFRPLIIGGVLFFISAGACIWMPDLYQPLVQTLAIVAGYLVPGYLLKSAPL